MVVSAIEYVAIVLFVEWALIHVAAFFMIAVPAWSDKLGAGGAFAAMDLLMAAPEYKKEFDAAVPARLSGKMIFQHGVNLGWIGLWSGIVVPMCIVYQNRMAWVMSLVPFFADVGYFVAFDLFKLAGGIGQAQTYIVSIGSILTAVSVHEHHGPALCASSSKLPPPFDAVHKLCLDKVQSDAEFYASIIVPSCLIFFGILEKLELTDKLLHCCGANTRADYDTMGPRAGGERSTAAVEMNPVSAGA
jgi:hypothetical protein